MYSWLWLLAAGLVLASQDRPVSAEFPLIKKIQNGNLVASYVREGDGVTITIKSVPAAESEGWAGVCVESRMPVDLTNFTRVYALVKPSARVTMDVKIEKRAFQDGTILLSDHAAVGRATSRTPPTKWDLRNAPEVGGKGTLTQAQRMCFIVVSDEYPGGTVTLSISGIRFDR